MDIGLSLEEIIKLKKVGKSSNAQNKRLPKNNSKTSGVRGRTSSVGGRVNGRVNKPSRQSRQPVDARMKSPRQPVDARMKIIQKTRSRLTDARDKLAEIAKQTDARSRIKGRKMSNQNGRQNPRGRNEYRFDQKIPVQQVLKRSIKNNVATNLRDDVLSFTPSQQATILQRSIKNNVSANLRDPSSMIRCTINRNASNYGHSYGDEIDIDEPLPVHHDDMSGIQVALKNEYTHHFSRQDYLTNREPYMDAYEPLPYRPMDTSRSLRESGSGEPRRMSLQMRARLDTPARLYRPRSPSPPSLPQGHRIVVSNLHPSVTHEDIKELFEDLGPLLTSRLVRPGTAEVIYKFQKDAKKAVDAYHNRQLDGQPMKCLLVNSRPATSSSGVLKANNAVPKFPNSSKSMVVPDLSAIHKALFTSK